MKKETETWESLLLSKTNEITGLQDDLIKLNIEKNNTKTAVQDISKAYSDQLSREKGEVTKLKKEIEQLQEELSYSRQQYQTLDNQHKSSVLQLQTFVKPRKQLDHRSKRNYSGQQNNSSQRERT